MEEKQKKKILFIEDDPVFRKAFYEKLTRKGYYVVAQTGAESAKDWAFSKKAGNFDMVISDQRMPGELGASFLQFLAKLEKVNPEKLDSNSEIYKELRERLSNLGESEFREQLKEMKAHPAIRVILSGYAEDDSVRKGLESGEIRKFISKKEEPDEIMATIERLLRE